MQLTEWLLFFASGTLGGVLSSAPFGPINLRVIQLRSLGLGATAFLAGVILADSILAFSAAVGVSAIVPKTILHELAMLLGAVFLIFGFRQIFRRPKPSVDAQSPLSGSRRVGMDFALGFILCFLNPAFLSFWVAWFAGTLSMVGSGSSWSAALPFFSGAAFGDLVWFIVLHWFCGSSWVKKFSTRTQQLTSWALVAFGAAMILKGGYGAIFGRD